MKNIHLALDKFLLKSRYKNSSNLYFSFIFLQKQFSHDMSYFLLFVTKWELYSLLSLKNRINEILMGKISTCQSLDLFLLQFSDQFSAYFKFCAEEDSCIHYVREKRQENNILRAFFEV